ncbi:MAG: hypothetical protein HYY26_07320 [Acidobacteria bacterium]|nr:hypothetical protein [Acidobacteriota bacterium]
MTTFWKVAFLLVGLALVAAILVLAWTVTGTVVPSVHTLPPMEKVKTYVALIFSGLVALAFVFSMFAMFYLKLKNPEADVSNWLTIFLTCLGYIVGILAGLFGIALPAQAITPG